MIIGPYGASLARRVGIIAPTTAFGSTIASFQMSRSHEKPRAPPLVRALKMIREPSLRLIDSWPLACR